MGNGEKLGINGFPYRKKTPQCISSRHLTQSSPPPAPQRRHLGPHLYQVQCVREEAGLEAEGKGRSSAPLFSSHTHTHAYPHELFKVLVSRFWPHHHFAYCGNLPGVNGPGLVVFRFACFLRGSLNSVPHANRAPAAGRGTEHSGLCSRWGSLSLRLPHPAGFSTQGMDEVPGRFPGGEGPPPPANAKASAGDSTPAGRGGGGAHPGAPPLRLPRPRSPGATLLLHRGGGRALAGVPRRPAKWALPALTSASKSRYGMPPRTGRLPPIRPHPEGRSPWVRCKRARAGGAGRPGPTAPACCPLGLPRLPTRFPFRMGHQGQRAPGLPGSRPPSGKGSRKGC